MHALTDLGKADNVMDALFGLEMEEEFTCEESGESKISKSTAKKLVCNIQGGAGASTQAREEELERGGGGGGKDRGGHGGGGGIGDGRDREARQAGGGCAGVAREAEQSFGVPMCIRCAEGPQQPCLCPLKENTRMGASKVQDRCCCGAMWQRSVHER